MNLIVRRLMATVVVMAVASMAMAQVKFWDGSRAERPLTFGVRAGMNISELNVSGTETKFGFFGGIAADINIVNSFSINSGAFFTQKGGKFGLGTMIDEMNGKARMTLNFIEIPVYASYRLRINDSHTSQIFFGPYFDFGIYGKGTVKYFEGNATRTESEGLFNDDNGFRRFQAGLGIGIAHTWNNISVGLSFQGGLTDVADGLDAEWNNFNVSIGYNF
ncbi:MAG: porin family protein [Bacteroides sp.]|nr:porin family protein [Bacteroides sp.]